MKNNLWRVFLIGIITFGFFLIPLQDVIASDSGIVIYEVYGAGGNSGATYDSDFVVLFNAGTAPYTINNWSLQYASATGSGNFSGSTVLNGITLQAGQYYLVQMPTSGTAGAPLPVPDIPDGSLNMASISGKVVLATGTTNLDCNGGSTTCSPADLARIVDLVGYGSANYFEGAGSTGNLSATNAAIRNNGGCTDTDNNNSDFTVSPVAPLNSSSAVNVCGPPAVSSITRADPDPTNAASVDFTVMFSKPVTGVDTTDFTLNAIGLSGAGVTGISGTGTTYTVTASTGTGNGTLRLDVVDDDTIIDAGSTPLGGAEAGNGDYSAGETYTLDKSAPTVLTTSTAANPTNTSPIPVVFTFSENVTGFVAGDVSVGNGTLSNFAGGGSAYSADITPTANGVVTVDVPTGAAVDTAGNSSTVAPQFSITYDAMPPSVTVDQAGGQPDPTSASPINFTAVFGEPIDVSSFTSGDVSLGGSAAPTSASITQIAPNDDTTFNLAVSGMAGSGTVTASLASGVISDMAGNSNTASTSTDNSVDYDVSYPSVSSILRSNTNPTNLASVGFDITFSKSVTGVDSGDFVLSTSGITGASLVTVTGSGNAYSVTVHTGSGSGTLRLDVVDDDSIIDTLSNPIGGTGNGNGNFNSGETYTINRSAQSSDAGIIINEISNGLSGSKEWMELIVVGSTPTVNLTGWIIDDNNGDFDSFAAGKGIARGHLRFADPMPACASGQSLASAPVGARILVYNSDDVEGSLAAYPNDPCDLDGDGVYYLPVGANPNNTPHLQVCSDQPRISPTPTMPDYSGCAYTSPADSWDAMNLLNTGDAAQTRRPDSIFYHGFAYDNLTVPPAPLFPNGDPSFNLDTASGTNSAYQFTCGNYFSNAAGQFTRLSAASANPGEVNTIENAVFTRSLQLGTYDFADLNTIENCRIEPLVTMEFLQSQVAVNQPAQLSITLSNPYNPLDSHALDLLGVQFTNNLPTGMILSGPNPVSNSCGGTFTGADGAASFNLSGVALPTLSPPISRTCTLVINVSAAAAGSYTNSLSTGAVTSTAVGVGGGSNINPASAVLTVGTVPPSNDPSSDLPDNLPATGFSPGSITLLPSQSAAKAYDSFTKLVLEIPTIGLQTSIVGVPLREDGWDVTWLGDQAGWLEGTAFPTWNGNSSITAHVWDALNNPGQFARLNELQWGDRVLIHFNDSVYAYEVRTTQTVDADDTSLVHKHEELPWLTLITCQHYDAMKEEYANRLIVRAVLVEIN